MSATQDTLDEAPTATEFVPAEEWGVRDDTTAGVRFITVDDGDVKVIDEEPRDDDVENRSVVCDECGFTPEPEDDIGAMADHLEDKHE